jgi:hypothetical protein
LNLSRYGGWGVGHLEEEGEYSDERHLGVDHLEKHIGAISKDDQPPSVSKSLVTTYREASYSIKVLQIFNHLISHALQE